VDIEIWKDIAIEHDGKVITGSYCVSDRMLTVKTKDGRTKSTRMLGNPPALIAKSLLHELAETTD
jgi:hypothetical protein